MLPLFKSLVGKKNTATHTAEIVIATPTLGDFSITESIAKKLGVGNGEFALITEGADGKVYLAAGKTGTPLLDVNNNPVYDDRNRQKFVEGTGIGSVLRPKSAGSTLLKLTSAAAWTMCGASKEGNTEFTLGEGIEGQMMIDANGSETDENNLFTTTFYPLELKSFRPKSKADDSEEGEDEDETSETTSEDTTTPTETVQETVNDYPADASGFEAIAEEV